MIEIKLLSKADIPLLEAAFAPFYAKPASIFEGYLQEKDRKVWIAHHEIVKNEAIQINNNLDCRASGSQFRIAGYITLKNKSKYHPFADANIPEIMDLNVLPPFRNQGIASMLLDTAEEEAGKSSRIAGLGVGLYKDYGSAQRLYIKRGYIPDGTGVTYDYKQIDPGSTICLDDDLVLWMRKKIR